MDFLLGVFFFQAIHEVKFRADRPFGTRGGFANRFDDFARGAGDIRDVIDLLRALRVDEDLDPLDPFAEGMNVLRLEHLVYRTVSLPKNDARVFDCVFAVATQGIFVRIPNRHLLIGDSHFEGGVSSQMLIREKEDSLAPLERPFQHRFRIAAGADDPAMFATERLQARGTVDVGDGSEILGIDDFSELVPSRFDLPDGSHVRHGAAGRQIG